RVTLRRIALRLGLRRVTLRRLGRRRVGLRLRLGLRLGGGAAVGAVEAAALEDDAHRGEDLAQGSPAVGTLGEGLVPERLHDLEVLATLLAGVLVGGHGVISVG